MATGKQAHLVRLSGRHEAEQQDSDYLQLHTTHTHRNYELRTNLLSVPAYLWPYTAHVLLMMGGTATRNM